jgi:hypothetical protein
MGFAVLCGDCGFGDVGGGGGSGSSSRKTCPSLSKGLKLEEE